METAVYLLELIVYSWEHATFVDGLMFWSVITLIIGACLLPDGD